MIDFELYRGREQTGVKHFILAEYLQRFGPIIGSWCSTITYVDCFSGPWQEQSEEFKDTSFSIALEELRKARDTTQRVFGRTLALRAFFIEEDHERYKKLRGFAEQVSRTDVEIETRNDELENCIHDIVAFVRSVQRKNFPFLFIDPTGWTGFGLDTIAPLLKLDPGEVLINFMTGHIRRLVEHPDESQQEGFESLYGKKRCAEVLERVRGKSGPEREDILVTEYMEALREAGKFQHVSAAIVLNPAMDRTHFHLIYGTRNPKGLGVFKGAEKKAMEAMQQARTAVQDRKEEEKSKQPKFDWGHELPKLDNHYEELRGRYCGIARDHVLRTLKASGRCSYDRLYAMALEVPLTFESDLKDWIADWRKSGLVRVEGLKDRERVPKLGEGHVLVWLGGQGPDGA